MIYIIKYYATFSGEARVEASSKSEALSQLKESDIREIQELSDDLNPEDLSGEIIEELPF